MYSVEARLNDPLQVQRYDFRIRQGRKNAKHNYIQENSCLLSIKFCQLSFLFEPAAKT